MLVGYYNRFDPTKRYKKLLYRSGKVLQSAELNDMQEIPLHEIKGIGDVVFDDGTIARDAGLTVQAATGVATCEAGAVYLRGAVREVTAKTMTIATTGTVSVGIYLREVEITELEDPTLRDPAVDVRNHAEAGAGRLRVDVDWGFAGDGQAGEFHPVYTVVDGVVAPAKVIRIKLSDLGTCARMNIGTGLEDDGAGNLRVSLPDLTTTLGACAHENIGAGLEDDGAGSLRVSMPYVKANLGACAQKNIGAGLEDDGAGNLRVSLTYSTATLGACAQEDIGAGLEDDGAGRLRISMPYVKANLGACAQENIGAGLEDDGAGSLRISMPYILTNIASLQRRRLTAETTFYVSPSGNDTTGTGSSSAPWRQPQRAYDYISANIDPAGYAPRIKLADGTYDSVSLGPIAGVTASNAVNELNSTLPVLEGNTANPAAVVLDGNSNSTHGIGLLGRPLSAWRVIGCTFKGATYGVATMGGVLHLQNCRYDAAPWALLCAVDRGELYLGDSGRIVAGSQAAFHASGGGMIYGGSIAQTWYVDNNPEFTKAFLATLNGCVQDIAAITFSGSARGRRHYTENNCMVFVGGKYAPGDQSGSTGSFSSVS